MFNINRTQADPAMGIDDVTPSVNASPTPAGQAVGQHIALVSNQQASFSSASSSLVASTSSCTLTDLPDALSGEIFKHIVDLPDQVTLALALPSPQCEEVMRTFRMRTPEEKINQWVRHVIHGSQENMAFCLNSGVGAAVVNAIGPDGNTALLAATSKGEMATLTMLLKQPDLDVNLGAPIASAASRGYLEIVSSLLQRSDIDVNARDAIGFTALYAAVLQKETEIVMALLKHENIDPNRVLPLLEAAAQGQVDMVDALLKADGIQVNALNDDGNTALGLAAEDGHLDCVKRLLQHPQIEPNLATPLVKAAGAGHLEIVKILLDNVDIDINFPDARGNVALTEAACHGHAKIVETLLTREEIDVNFIDEEGHTALLWASSSGKDDIVAMLLDEPATDVNIVTGRGYSALAKAAANGDIEIVQQLLDHPDTDVELGAVLVECLAEGHIEVAKLLLQHPDIDVNAMDELGDTALGYAADLGRDDLVALLLAHPKIDPNRGSALVEAAMRGEQGIVRLLLDAPGIDINCRDGDGNTAMTVAERYGHPEIIRLLGQAARNSIDPINVGAGHSTQ